MSGEAREQFALAGIADGDIARFATTLPNRLRDDFTATMTLLRDPALQELLVNYPRTPRQFLRAVSQVDTVSSQYLIRDGLGREHRPDDYLQQFSQFIRENPTHIEAVRILLDRPSGWNTTALQELRTKLAQAPQRFTVDALQKAHQLQYHKSLVDLISMVKHAASQDNPLLTAAERAARAVARIAAGQTFSPEQRQWLDRIERHLAENLSIDPDDFEVIPAFDHAGGWGKANRVFDGKLRELLDRLNEALAA
jgi:type I restriction enzyme R subunit